MTSSTDSFRAARDLLLTHREDYEAAFNLAVKKQLPRFGLEIDLR